MQESDYEFVKNNYKDITVNEIAEKLNKKPITIYKAMYSMGINTGVTWSEEEITFLLNNYLNMSYKEIGKVLNRSASGVQGKAKLLGLNKADNRKWSDEEITYLKENINFKSYDEIAKDIHRSHGAIYNKVYELKLINNEYKGYKKLKREQIDFIIANCDKMTDNQLASKFEVSESAIVSVRKKHGITKTGNEVSGPSYIELYVKDLLDKYNIQYLHNEKLGDFLPDFQIINTNIIIEVQGDYFHCNPNIYGKGPKDEIQIKHVVRDYYKKCYYCSNGYSLIEIWEYDINHNKDKVEEIIKKIKFAVSSQSSQKT